MSTKAVSNKNVLDEEIADYGTTPEEEAAIVAENEARVNARIDAENAELAAADVAQAKRDIARDKAAQEQLDENTAAAEKAKAPSKVVIQTKGERAKAKSKERSGKKLLLGKKKTPAKIGANVLDTPETLALKQEK